MADFEPTDEQVERTARMLFARSKEGGDGWTWPINGEWGRKRDIDDARRFLVYVIGDVEDEWAGVTVRGLPTTPGSRGTDE